MSSGASRPGPGSGPPVADLDSVAEISEMVRRFYGTVAQDDLLGPMFNDVAKVDWAEHIPKLAMFWSRALLGVEGYAGNPFSKHAAVHAERPFSDAHFDRWLELFDENLILGWAGPNTDRARELAQNVARVHRSQLIERPISRGHRGNESAPDNRLDVAPRR